MVVSNRLDIAKQAMLYRIADELAGYTIHKDDELVGEWWDRKARKNYSQARGIRPLDLNNPMQKKKSGGKGEL